MRYQLLFENFIKAVKDEIPRNAKISAMLADILQIEKEAVYRRLRMDVPFTFSEIASVCQNLGISLDNIIGAIPSKSRPMRMTLIDYVEPLEIDYIMIENYLHLIDQIKEMNESEISMSCNVLPQVLYLKYEYITRFYLFKWMYLYGDALSIKRYSEIVVNDRIRDYQIEHLNGLRQIKNTNIIWDKLVFEYLIEDIKHFASVHLITEDEISLIKKDIENLLSEMESMACNGNYMETGNKLHFYVSNIYFENCYTYMEAPTLQLSMVSVFSLNAMATQDSETFLKIKNWMQSLKRVSTLISESGEKQRVMFFKKQRELLETL